MIKSCKITFLVVFAVACTTQNPSSENAATDSLWRTETPNQPLSAAALQDSLNAYRSRAFASEQTKLASGEELLKEIAQTIPRYDIPLWQEAQTKLEAMRLALYDSVSMANETVMDIYDQKTADFIASLDKLVSRTTDFTKYARAVLLYEEIKTADNLDFIIRKEYNQYAIQYNALLRSGKAQGQKAPLFWGEQPM